MAEQRLIKAIDADDFLRELREKKKKVCYKGCGPESWESAFLEFEAITESTPSVDAVPVVHGEWLVKCTAAGRKYTQCNKCRLALSFRDDKNRFHTLDMSKFDYCPNCGAKMDGGSV